jgi:methionyl-tRNA synthetase
VPRRFYVTTAIDYVNGRPHLGHAYEKVLADAIARYHRQRGDKTFFLTGTDEHGQKVARAAEAAGQTPKEFVDHYAATFKAAWKALGISHDHFIRTTDQRHGLAVQELFRRLAQARSPKTGEPVLFEQDYEGAYCEGCEAFKQDKDLVDGRCELHPSRPIKKIKESNFFFRLSEYDEALLKHVQAHPEFVRPDYRLNEVLKVLEEGLEDVSFSRPNLDWGIPLPEEIEGGEGHVAYVWGDALLNYLSALGWPERKYSLWWLAKESETGGPGATRQDVFAELDGQGRPGAAWAGTGQPQYTNAFHLIGKDISRFHCLLWPAMLLAAGVPLPRQVYVHGFVYARGSRLSKSSGNVIDPVAFGEAVGADVLRFWLLDAIPTGQDGNLYPDQFVDHVNSHLANKFGNLASRAVTLVHKYFEGNTPDEWAPESLADAEVRAALDAVIAAAATAATEVPKAYEDLRLHDALDAAWDVVERTNEFTDRAEPWKVGKDPARRAELGTALSALLETLRLVAVWAWPAIPAKSEELWTVLGLPGRPGETRGADAAPRYGATPSRPLQPASILFPRLELTTVQAFFPPTEEPAAPEPSAAPPAKGAKGTGKGAKG